MADSDPENPFGEDPHDYEQIPSQDEIDDADLVLISPFEFHAKRQFHKFKQRVIDPAVDAARLETGQEIRVVVLNPLVTEPSANLEMAYRVLHQAELCIADITDCDHRAIAFFSMRLTLSPGSAVALDRTRNRTAYPLHMYDRVENARPNHEEEVGARLRRMITDCMNRGRKGNPKPSPVFQELEALSVNLRGSPRKEFMPPDFHQYRLVERPDNPRIAIAVGDIRYVRGIDVWVNPENTKLEMAREFDPSISGTIRHLSSNWFSGGTISDDFMRRQVAQRLPGGRVHPGFAGLTACGGDLKTKNGVKAVAHVAAVELKGDHPGSGYEAVGGEYISLCVTNVLKEIDKSNRIWGRKTLKTVIMPLIGSYASPHLAEVNIGCMVRALVEYFLSDTGKTSQIEGIALLGYTDEDERLIRKAFGRDPRLERLSGDPTECL